MNKKDYYELLNVNKNSTTDEIKSSYRKLAMKYHPDRNPDDKESEEKFKEIAEAYEILSDSEKRSKYDKFGFDGVNGLSHSYNTASDIFSQFSDIFGNVFGGIKFDVSSPNLDIQLNIDLSIEDNIKQTKQTVTYKKYDKCTCCDGTGSKTKKINKCDMCGGTGYVDKIMRLPNGMTARTYVACSKCEGSGIISDGDCVECNGKGIKQHDITHTFTLEPGARNGSYIIIKNAGNVGKYNSIVGNLILIFNFKKHLYFNVQGNDIIYDLKLNFTDLILGCNVDVPTLYGEEHISINPGTQIPHHITLPNKGLIINNKTNDKGSQHVIISVNIPTEITASERELLIKLSESFKSKTTNK